MEAFRKLWTPISGCSIFLKMLSPGYLGIIEDVSRTLNNSGGDSGLLQDEHDLFRSLCPGPLTDYFIQLIFISLSILESVEPFIVG